MNTKIKDILKKTLPSHIAGRTHLDKTGLIKQFEE
jgi:hypothetical protein